jgi:hypothetical protein
MLPGISDANARVEIVWAFGGNRGGRVLIVCSQNRNALKTQRLDVPLVTLLLPMSERLRFDCNAL